ncbi:hypothetical protein [Lysinibacillus sp. LZ02]|uniref:hypothetical protein n=1 Tax=Lysinibacillus sp. LZ02 TaxID=3420668 RepID=UPI003D35EC32
MGFIPCQKCKQTFSKEWFWYVCDTCGFRVCHACHAIQGRKCEECAFGWMKEKN